jgi:transposase, IS5 family
MVREQMCLAEAFLDPRMGLRGKLKALAEVIDWAPLAALAEKVRPGETGRPPYPALAMLKAMYLAGLYDLSDPGLEEALIDRVSFRLFCGFSLEERTPDETTILRFRHDCMAAGVLEAVFAEVNRQFEAKGLMVKRGTLMDATIIAAASARPRRGAKAEAVKTGKAEAESAPEAGEAAPGDAACAPPVAREPGASFTRKGGKSYFGYRLHVGVDEGSGLVRRLALTPAHVNESCVAENLISGDEAAVYGDKGYENKKRRAALKARGVKDRIMHRSHKNQKALPHWQKRRNALIAKRRAPVERVFASLKRLYGRARMRYCAFQHNLADMIRAMTAHNLCRAARLAGM